MQMDWGALVAGVSLLLSIILVTSSCVWAVATIKGTTKQLATSIDTLGCHVKTLDKNIVSLRKEVSALSERVSHIEGSVKVSS